jgi:[acyl-carrier-protein] S-malonyltransferase
MSVAFIFGPTSPTADLENMVRLYQRIAAVRHVFDQISEWTGIGVDQLLRKSGRTEGRRAMNMDQLGLAAAMLGVQDALAELGVKPAVVGGLSLGDTVSAGASGALTRRQMVELLLGTDHGPTSDAPERQEAIAFAFVPAGQNPAPYHRPRREGVFLGADFGMSRSGEGRALMLAGYRTALEEFAADDPGGQVRVRDQDVCRAAYHSPLRRHAQARYKPMLDRTSVVAPAVPVCSGTLRVPATTADEVRDLLFRNHVEPALFEGMIAQVQSYRPRLAVAIGPAMTGRLFDFPFPVVRVDAPEHLADVIGSMSRFGAWEPAADSSLTTV